MTILFTENDLIRYIYGETSQLENSEIEHAVLCDSDLSEKLDELKSIYVDLNHLIISPSERAMDNIFKSSVLL